MNLTINSHKVGNKYFFENNFIRQVAKLRIILIFVGVHILYWKTNV